MERITVGEFVQHTSKYLKPRDTFIMLTRYKKDYLKIFIMEPERHSNEYEKPTHIAGSTENVPKAEEILRACRHEGCTRNGISDKGYCSDHWKEGK